jgi:hypothetical protein
MRLARVDTETENSWLVQTPSFSAPDWQQATMWLGGSDLGAEGEWQWTDGTAFYSGGPTGSPVGGLYTNWVAGQPDNANGSEHCLAVSLAGTTASWLDSDCTLAAYYVCEAY